MTEFQKKLIEALEDIAAAIRGEDKSDPEVNAQIKRLVESSQKRPKAKSAAKAAQQKTSRS